jgi:hypothetical protein
MRGTARGTTFAALALLAMEGQAQAQAPEKAAGGATRELPTGERARDGAKITGDELAGVVAEVRPVEGTIRVKAGDEPDREIVVRSETAITVEGRSATLEEIHPGAEIRASLTHGDLSPVATRIEVGPGLAAPAASARGAAEPGEKPRDAEDAADAAETEAGEGDAPDR